MIGVVTFELTQNRTILFIFPNTFEYFFLFVEAVRLGWDTKHMGRRTVILSAAAIWIFIKLPQEWWIHIAQLDMTDFIKETLFGVDPSATWAEAVANRPWVVVLAIVIIAAIVLIAYWIIKRKAPPFDHGLRIKPDPLPAWLRGAEPYRRVRAETSIFGWALREKVALTAIVSVIFGLMLTGGTASALRIIIGVAIFTVINAAVSHWMALRGRSWRLLAGELVTMLIVNLDHRAGAGGAGPLARRPQRARAVRHDAVLLVPADAGHRAVRPLPHGVQGAAPVPPRREGGAAGGELGTGRGAGLIAGRGPAWTSCSTTSCTSTAT